MIIYIKNNTTFHTLFQKLQNSMHKCRSEPDLKTISSYRCIAYNNVIVRGP